MEKPITQEDSFGCGIACVAFITNANYKKAKSVYFKNSSNARTFGYLCKDLVKALATAKKEYGYKYIKKQTKFKNKSIVFIKRSKRYPSGHYLVKTEGGWMDPWINFNLKNPDILKAHAGIRKRLPGRPIYLISQVQRTK